MKRYRPSLMWMLFDAAGIAFSVYFAYWVYFNGKLTTTLVDEYFRLLPMLTICYVAGCLVAKSYAILWLYADSTDRLHHIMGCFIGYGAQTLFIALAAWRVHAATIMLSACFFIVMVTSATRFIYRWFLLWTKARHGKRNPVTGQIRSQRKRLLIYGGGIAGSALIDSIRLAQGRQFEMIGIIDDDPAKRGRHVRGIPVLGGRGELKHLVSQYAIDAIIIAINTAPGPQMREILLACKDTNCELRRLRSVEETVDCRVENVRPVDVLDLLGREPVRLDNTQVASILEGRVVMVTGGGGSIGSELCRQILCYNPKLLIILDIYENNAYAIEQELLFGGLDPNRLKVIIGSIQDRIRLQEVFDAYRPDVVFHAAAHKHVPLMEHSPCEAIKNNVFGTQNVMLAAHHAGTKRFVMVSTDKAVNPTNVMGASKRLAEMLVQSFGRHSDTHFSAVRFGNVLGSNGSIVPKFQQQIALGGPVTVTHPDIIRYFMTIPEAVSLVLQSAALSKGGEVFVLNMGEPVRIDDLARDMIRLSGLEPDVDIKIDYTGLRPGEKLYEEMLMDEEGLLDSGLKDIKIGRPLELSYEDMEQRLAGLKACIDCDPHHIRNCLQQMLPTYHPKNLPAEYLDTLPELEAYEARLLRKEA